MPFTFKTRNVNFCYFLIYRSFLIKHFLLLWLNIWMFLLILNSFKENCVLGMRGERGEYLNMPGWCLLLQWVELFLHWLLWSRWYFGCNFCSCGCSFCRCCCSVCYCHVCSLCCATTVITLDNATAKHSSASETTQTLHHWRHPDLHPQNGHQESSVGGATVSSPPKERFPQVPLPRRSPGKQDRWEKSQSITDGEPNAWFILSIRSLFACAQMLECVCIPFCVCVCFWVYVIGFVLAGSLPKPCHLMKPLPQRRVVSVHEDALSMTEGV